MQRPPFQNLPSAWKGRPVLVTLGWSTPCDVESPQSLVTTSVMIWSVFQASPEPNNLTRTLL